MEKVYVIGAVRTPVGSFGGALKDVPAVELGSIVIEEAIKGRVWIKKMWTR